MTPRTPVGPLRAALAGALALLALGLVGCAQTGTSPEQPAATAAYTPNPQPALETELQYRARLHTELGANYFARGQFDVAIEELNEAIRLVPGYGPAHGVMALVHWDMGEFERAEGSFLRALQLSPQDPEIRNNYGWYLCQRGREREGLAQFDTALRSPLYKTPELAMLNAGNCHLRLGDVRAAEPYFRRAQALQPGNRKVAQGLAHVAYRDGKYRDAQLLLRPALQPPAPDVLLLSGCIDRALGDAAGERSTLSQMRSLFPDTPERRELESGRCP